MAKVSEVNSGNWEREVLQSKVLTVVDFWHERCPWCLRLNPVIDEFSEEYKDKMKFVKFNVLASPDNRQLAIKYGIMGTPTLIFFCEGRPVETLVGFTSKERLKPKLDEMLEKHRECAEQSTELKI